MITNINWITDVCNIKIFNMSMNVIVENVGVEPTTS